MQQVRKNFRLRKGRRSKCCLAPLYFNFLWLLLHCRRDIDVSLKDKKAPTYTHIMHGHNFLFWEAIKAAGLIKDSVVTYYFRFHGFIPLFWLLTSNSWFTELLPKSPSWHRKGELDRTATLLTFQEGVVNKLQGDENDNKVEFNGSFCWSDKLTLSRSSLRRISLVSSSVSLFSFLILMMGEGPVFGASLSLSYPPMRGGNIYCWL